MHSQPHDTAGPSIVSPALVATCVMRARGAVRPQPAPEVFEMKRIFPLVLVSIALSMTVARLIASGRFEAIRARIVESCEAMTQGIAPVVGRPIESELAA